MAAHRLAEKQARHPQLRRAPRHAAAHPDFPPGRSGQADAPGFDISIDRLHIDNLTLAAGMPGRARSGWTWTAQCRLRTDGSTSPRAGVSAAPTATPSASMPARRHDFDLPSTTRRRERPVAQMLGADSAWRAGGGDGPGKTGTASRWCGATASASLRSSDQPRRPFGLLGQAYPGEMLSGRRPGWRAKQFGGRAARIGGRRIDGRYAARARLAARRHGLLDLDRTAPRPGADRSVARAPDTRRHPAREYRHRRDGGWRLYRSHARPHAARRAAGVGRHCHYGLVQSGVATARVRSGRCRSTPAWRGS